MRESSRPLAKVALGLATVVLGMLGLAFLGQSESMAAQQSNFMGGRPSVEDSEEVRTVRLLFPAGVRSNWHWHTDGQLLMLEDGKARTQVRGGPILEVYPGQPWWTPAGVEHWHGAAPDEASHQLTIYSGTVEWLEPVPDAAYNAPVGSR